MGTFKWITGVLGWVSGGPIGALLGFLLGSIVERSLAAVNLLGSGDDSQAQSQTYQRTYRTVGGYTATEQRNSFMVSLLVLSSVVMRADGKTLQSEIDYVKSFIRQNFGEAAVGDAVRILSELESREINVYSVGTQVSSYMNYSQRLQLFHYLVGIANADGNFCKEEKSVLESIASAIRLNASDAGSVIAMFYRNPDSAYAVLEISPSASDDEVKSAYRRMAMKNHPDKVATLGPDVQKAAEEKFRRVQEAYETIKKQRGLK